MSDRICSLCNVIEDEYHCLIECPRYVNEREMHLPKVLKKNPSMFKFINVLKSDDPKLYGQVGILCFKIMKEHRKFV